MACKKYINITNRTSQNISNNPNNIPNKDKNNKINIQIDEINFESKLESTLSGINLANDKLSMKNNIKSDVNNPEEYKSDP